MPSILLKIFTPEKISNHAQVKREPKAIRENSLFAKDGIGNSNINPAAAQTIIGRLGFWAITIFPD